MDDLISRQAVIDALDCISGVEEVLRSLPSAQSEIIRCEECKYNSNTCGNYVNCDIIPQMFGRTVDNFCSMAERRTDDC